MSISGLVAKSNVAIVGPRVRFPADAFYFAIHYCAKYTCTTYTFSCMLPQYSVSITDPKLLIACRKRVSLIKLFSFVAHAYDATLFFYYMFPNASDQDYEFMHTSIPVRT